MDILGQLPSQLYHPETGISNEEFEEIRRYWTWRDRLEQEAIDRAKAGK